MRTGYVVALALVAFVLGAFLTGAAAHGGMGSMMSDWTPAQMFEACQRMMGGGSP